MYYPNFWEYAYTFNNSFNELKKEFSNDRLYPLPKKQLSKNYNNQVGLVYSMNDVTVLPKERNANKSNVSNSIHLNDNIVACEKLVEKYPCTRCKLTIREATCKDKPVQRKTFGNIYCPYENCVKMYKYHECLINHLKNKHGLNEQQIQNITGSVELQQNKEIYNKISIVDDETDQPSNTCYYYKLIY